MTVAEKIADGVSRRALLTGGLAGGKAYCQPMMISTESTIATMKFFWSIAGELWGRL